MKRIAMTVLLKDDPEIIRRYEEYHANQWPEVRECVIADGIQRVFIYRYGRQLFMFIEAQDDFEMEAMVNFKSHPKAKEWDELMRGFQEPVPGAGQGETWVEMKEIHALDVGQQQ